MCGIAGIVDLTGRNSVPDGALAAMAEAIVHRGPDEDGFFDSSAVGMASRRLSIIGLRDGRQPISNEDGSVCVVFNGELFDYPELKTELESKGHRFATHFDTQVIPHLSEDHAADRFDHMQGKFS